MKTIIKVAAMFLCALLICGNMTACVDVEPVANDSTTTTEETIRSTTTTSTTTTQATTTTTRKTTTTTITTAKKTTTTQIKTTTSTKAPSLNTDTMVWIPTNGGTKYHKKSDCSKMINPEYVTLTEAKNRGFTACGRCYK